MGPDGDQSLLRWRPSVRSPPLVPRAEATLRRRYGALRGLDDEHRQVLRPLWLPEVDYAEPVRRVRDHVSGLEPRREDDRAEAFAVDRDERESVHSAERYAARAA